jgi:hypothetical protein
VTCRHSGHPTVDFGLVLCASPIRAHRFPRVAPRGPHSPFADDGAFNGLYDADGGGEHGARDRTYVAPGAPVRSTHVHHPHRDPACSDCRCTVSSR